MRIRRCCRRIVALHFRRLLFKAGTARTERDATSKRKRGRVFADQGSTTDVGPEKKSDGDIEHVVVFKTHALPEPSSPSRASSFRKRLQVPELRQ